MVKALHLGLLAAIMCGLVSSAPQKIRRDASPPEEDPDEDPAARNQRSADLTSVNRKIQMFVKNRHLQILPDGTVNGTTDDRSTYTVLQRTSVGIGLMKIQGVATCQYLCMDICGLLYGSREFNDECVFNETIEQHNYNTYSSTKYSDERRTLYLAMNRRGQPRKVLLRASQQLGRLSSYTRVLTHPASGAETAEEHPVRHRGHVCEKAPEDQQQQQQQQELGHPRCRRRRKKKKKRKKCDEPSCIKTANKRKKCESEDSNECQRIEVTVKKKNKKASETLVLSGVKKKNKKFINKRRRGEGDEASGSDEDYGSTTAWDWDEATAVPGTPDDSSTAHPD